MFNLWRTGLIPLAALCLVPGLIDKSAASEWDQRTDVTFSGPVEIPGKVLPAGTYVMKLMVPNSSVNVIGIFDKEEKKPYAILLALPDYRVTPSDKTIINFNETQSGSPQAIRSWFYPGREYGHQFVYPHKEAVDIAKRTNQNVLSMPDDSAKNLGAAGEFNDSRASDWQKTKITGVRPNGEPIDAGQVVTPAPKK